MLAQAQQQKLPSAISFLNRIRRLEAPALAGVISPDKLVLVIPALENEWLSRVGVLKEKLTAHNINYDMLSDEFNALQANIGALCNQGYSLQEVRGGMIKELDATITGTELAIERALIYSSHPSATEHLMHLDAAFRLSFEVPPKSSKALSKSNRTIFAPFLDGLASAQGWVSDTYRMASQRGGAGAQHTLVDDTTNTGLRLDIQPSSDDIVNLAVQHKNSSYSSVLLPAPHSTLPASDDFCGALLRAFKRSQESSTIVRIVDCTAPLATDQAFLAPQASPLVRGLTDESLLRRMSLCSETSSSSSRSSKRSESSQRQSDLMIATTIAEEFAKCYITTPEPVPDDKRKKRGTVKR